MGMGRAGEGGGSGGGSSSGGSAVSEGSSLGEGAILEEEETDFVDCLHPLPGWMVQAVRRMEVAGEAGMWSSANGVGIRLQGWADTIQDIEQFVHLPTVCPGCEQEMRNGGSNRQDSRSCSHPAFLAALRRGVSVKDAEALICRHQSSDECFFALEVLASLVQEEEWMFSKGDGQASEHLGCLKHYLNQHFLRLAEEGKVVQCFDDRGQAQWAVFCTGLLTRGTEEPIFAVLQRCARTSTGWTSWQLFGFVPLRKLQDPAQLWNKVEAIVTPPEQANFVEDQSDLLYAGGISVDALQLHPQLWEDLESHLEAFPSSLLEPGITAQGRKQVAMAAVGRAIQTVGHNPFAAVPMVQRSVVSNAPVMQLQLLLPLKLDSESSRAHLALAVEASKSRRGARMYRATRVLSLEQAYMQARVLMPVCQPWLAAAVRNRHTSNSTTDRSGDQFNAACLPSAAVLQEALEAQDLPMREGSLPMRSTLSGGSHSAPYLYSPSMGSHPSPRSVTSSGSTLPEMASFLPSQQQHYAMATSAVGNPRSPSSEGVRPSSGLPSGAGGLVQAGSEGLPYSPSGSSSGRSEVVQVPTFPSSLPGAVVSVGGGGISVFHAREGSASVGGLPSPRLRHSSSLPAGYASGMRRSHGEYHSDPGLGQLSEKKSYSTSSWHLQGYDDPLSPMRPTGRFEGRSLLPLDIPETSNTVQVLSLSPVPGGGDSKTSSYAGNLGGHSWGTAGGSVSSALLGTTVDGSFSSNGQMSSEHGSHLTLSPAHMNGSTFGGLTYRSDSVERLWTGGIDYDSMGGRADEYVEFTPQDDLCPKLNISQLPPMFVHDFYTGKNAYGEVTAVNHFEQVFSEYGLVTKVVSREHSKHQGKFFAIVEFQYWRDEMTRARLVAGEQICFQRFYKTEEVLIRRHKDKHKVTLSASASLCRPDWKYTGIDTRTGKPLYKGPCSNCTRECTVPFKPVVKGQPPRCRACLPYVMGGLFGATSQNGASSLVSPLSPHPSMGTSGLQYSHPTAHFMEPGPVLTLGRC